MYARRKEWAWEGVEGSERLSVLLIGLDKRMESRGRREVCTERKDNDIEGRLM